MKNLTPEEWRDNYDQMENMAYGHRKLSPLAVIPPIIIIELVILWLIFIIF